MERGIAKAKEFNGYLQRMLGLIFELLRRKRQLESEMRRESAGDQTATSMVITKQVATTTKKNAKNQSSISRLFDAVLCIC